MMYFVCLLLIKIEIRNIDESPSWAEIEIFYFDDLRNNKIHYDYLREKCYRMMGRII